jgi:hypothetical protein
MIMHAYVYFEAFTGQSILQSNGLDVSDDLLTDVSDDLLTFLKIYSYFRE